MTQCVAQRPLLTFSDIFDLSWPYLGWVNLRSKVNALFLSTRGLQGTQNWSKGLEMKEETLGNPSVCQTFKVKVKGIVKVASSIAFIMYQTCLRNSIMFGNMFLLIMILRVAQRPCLTLSDLFNLAWHYPGRANSRSKVVALFLSTRFSSCQRKYDWTCCDQRFRVMNFFDLVLFFVWPHLLSEELIWLRWFWSFSSHISEFHCSKWKVILVENS